MRDKVSARVETGGAGTRECVRRDKRAGGVFGSVDAVAVTRQRENAWLASYRYSKAKQEFRVTSAAAGRPLAYADSRLTSGQQNGRRLDGKSVEAARAGDPGHDSAEFAALAFDRVAENQRRQAGFGRSAAAAKASEGAAMTRTVFCAASDFGVSLLVERIAEASGGRSIW